ncbi:MAG: hypothetical protein NTY14_07355, partial [Candidatus Omnitrophica bacterium]|nr:hypothetical protein [Candidatus Omnitrophota bacterium]
ALAPADIGQMIGIAVRVGQEMGGKIFYMGMNWKASEPKPAAGFVKLFQGTDLSKIRISIGTPTVKLVKDEIQKPVDSWKQKLISLAGRVKLEFASLRGFVAADAQQNELKGGKAWSEMTAEMIKPKMRAVLDGIKDSRGKQTIRVVMEVPGLGIEVYGEAPAGKSTGDAEAKTVDLETQEGKDRVMNEIMPFISKKLEEGKYDFRDYKDVVRFHEMLIKEAGEDYSKLGGNVTTAVSFAIYELYAKLNNMNLDKAIAKAEPEAVGTGVINYISNMLNGGLHSIVEELGEKLGIDRMSIQEIMFVPLARSYVKRLLMLDQADERLGKRLTTAYGKENIARGDEAGFKIKFTGKADDKAAIRHVIEQAVEAGLKPGKDFLISLDVAASEFYNKDTKMYTFLGEEKTSQAMIDFYVEMVEEYKKEYGVNVFYSIEDGLAQDDWDGWVKLTQAMDKYDILTVGDDLFCTNIERLRKGIEMGAASAILIKVNQNGTVWGTLKTIALARQAAGMGARKKDIKVFLSHRSGETKYTGISFLASGVKAEALKTGASQPETAYPDQNTWVRRAKYLVMNLLGQGHVFNKKDKAMLVSTDYIAKAGIKGISELEKFSNTQLIVYGKNARKAVQLLGIEGLDTKQIMTARNQDNAIKAAKLELGIQVEDIVVVRTPAEQEAKYGFAGNMEVLKQVAAEGASPALELGKAVKMLYKNREVNLAFEKVIEAVDAKVVEKLTNDQKIALLESNRGTFDFTDTYMELKLTDKVAKSVEGVEREVRTVLSQI